MKILLDVRFYLVAVVAFFLGLLINDLILKNDFIKRQTNKEYISGGDIEKTNLQQTVDSLQLELFNQQTITGRYEIALEILKEKDKKAAEMYELILTTQTE